MDVHLQVVELAEVVRGALVDGTGVTIGKIDNLHRHRLLILLIRLRGHAVGGLADDAGRQHVGNRHTVGVLFETHRSDIEGALSIVLRREIVAVLAQTQIVGAPAAADQLEGGQTADNRLLEVAHEDTHETDGVEARHTVHDFVGVVDRNTELIPLGRRPFAIGQHVRVTLIDIVDVVLAHHHLVGRQVNHILVVTLVLAQGVIVVHILHVREVGGGGRIVFGALAVGRGVSVGVVVVFVTLNHLEIQLVIIAAPEIVVVIARRVVNRVLVRLRTGSESGRHAVDVGFREIIPLPDGRQSVVTHILMLAGIFLVVERVHNQLFGRHATPNREFHIIIGTVLRQTVLEELPTVAKNILRDVTEVKIELTTLVIGIIDEGIHHPELDILVVGRFEVGIVELTHDTAPTGLGVAQRTILQQTAGEALRAVHIVVVGTPLGRIEGNVEDRHQRGELRVHRILVGE